MRIIKLTNEYYIEIDPLNYTLRQEYVGKTKEGKEKKGVRTIGYFSNMKNAVDRFLKMNQVDELRDFSGDFKEYVKKVDEANKTAVKAICEVLEG